MALDKRLSIIGLFLLATVFLSAGVCFAEDAFTFL